MSAGSTTSGTLAPTVSTLGVSSFVAGPVTVASGATLLAAARPGRSSITLINEGSTAVRYGPTSGVTTGTGGLLAANAQVTINTQSAVYGIVASGSQAVTVIETF